MHLSHATSSIFLSPCSVVKEEVLPVGIIPRYPSIPLDTPQFIQQPLLEVTPVLWMSVCVQYGSNACRRCMVRTLTRCNTSRTQQVLNTAGTAVCCLLLLCTAVDEILQSQSRLRKKCMQQTRIYSYIMTWKIYQVPSTAVSCVTSALYV